MLELNEAKVKGKGERIIGSVVGRGSGVVNGHAREGVALVLIKRVQERVVEYREVSARQMWVRLSLEGVLGVCQCPWSRE